MLLALIRQYPLRLRVAMCTFWGEIPKASKPRLEQTKAGGHILTLDLLSLLARQSFLALG